MRLADSWETGEATRVILNDEPLYRAAVKYADRCKRKGRTPTLGGYLCAAGLNWDDIVSECAGFRWKDKRIGRREVLAAVMGCAGAFGPAADERLEPQPYIEGLTREQATLRHLGGKSWAIPSMGKCWRAPTENHEPVYLKNEQVWVWRLKAGRD